MQNPTRSIRVLSIALILAVWLTVVVYTEQNGLTFPQNEGWTIVMSTATASADGTLQFRDLLRRNEVHIVFFPLLTTAINARLTDWNLLVELRIGLVLLTATFLLMADVYRRHDRDALWYGLPLLALLLFTPLQDANLLWQFTSLQWFYQPFFFLVALWGFMVLPPTFLGLLWVMVFSFGSIMSSAGGLALLPLFTLILWMRGYRIKHYALWLAFAGVLLFIWMTRIVGGSSADSAGSASIQIMLLNWVSLFGDVFMPHVLNGVPIEYYWFIFWVGGLSALFFVAERWRSGEIKQTALWVALLGYGAGTTLMIAIGRSYNDSGGVPLSSRLLTMALFVWLGLVGLAVDYVRKHREKLLQFRLSSVPVWWSVALLLWIGFLGARSTAIHFDADRGQGFLGHFTVAEGEQCYWGYFVSYGETCGNYVNKLGIGAVKEQLDDLFTRRWAMYSDYAGFNRAVTNMPDLFKPTDKVIISAEEALQHVRDVTDYDVRLNRQVNLNRDQLMRIGGEDMDFVPELATTSLYNITTPDEAALDSLRQFVQMTDRVWYMRGHTETDFDRTYRAVLEEQFTPVRMDGGDWNTTVYEDVTLYLREPSPAYWFGEDIGLESWRVVNSSPYPCERLPLEMLWYADTDISETYSLALVLVDDAGLPVVRYDNAPGGYTTQLWREGTFYPASDDFDLLCEPELGGRYDLLMGVYLSGTDEALPITTTDGAPLGDLLYLTTIEIAQ